MNNTWQIVKIYWFIFCYFSKTDPNNEGPCNILFSETTETMGNRFAETCNVRLETPASIDGFSSDLSGTIIMA